MEIRTREEVVKAAFGIVDSIREAMEAVEKAQGTDAMNPLVVIFDPTKPDQLQLVQLWDIAISIAVRQGT